VLAANPSSTRTGCSIPGDKTRMAVATPIAGCRHVSTLSEGLDRTTEAWQHFAILEH
jgi:putative protein kinase ArgK-like GTPase of G3E family